MAKTVTEKALIQQILDSNLDMDDKLDILVQSGIPLGAEYVLKIKITADEKGTEWMDQIGSFLLTSDKVVSFSVTDLLEKELGDDEWVDAYWVPPSKPVVSTASRQFATTGAQSGSWRSPNPVLLHITDDDVSTLCGKVIKPAWKKVPFDSKVKTFRNSKPARQCPACLGVAVANP